MGHPLEHGQPISSHIFKEELIFPSPAANNWYYFLSKGCDLGRLLAKSTQTLGNDRQHRKQ